MDPGERTEIPLFVEERRFRQWWLWLILLLPVGVAWAGFWRQIVQGERFGNRPAPDWVLWVLWLAVGIGLPLLFYAVTLRVEVRPSSVVVLYQTPLLALYRRTIPAAQIESAQAVTYHPIREYGGWGLRRGWDKSWCYNVSGNRGVRLRLTGSAGVLLGSQQPELLAQAIQQAAHTARPR